MTGYWQNLIDEEASDETGYPFWMIFAALCILAGCILAVAAKGG
jgi:hypothetical protein